MITAALVIEYLDGTTETVHATQYEHGQFERWANRQGYQAPAKRSVYEAMPTVAHRYWAWCAKHRDSDPKPSFDAWERTVGKVELEDTDAVDPTQTAQSVEPSPE